jgi:hypothetical protein
MIDYTFLVDDFEKASINRRMISDKQTGAEYRLQCNSSSVEQKIFICDDFPGGLTIEGIKILRHIRLI